MNFNLQDPGPKEFLMSLRMQRRSKLSQFQLDSHVKFNLPVIFLKKRHR